MVTKSRRVAVLAAVPAPGTDPRLSGASMLDAWTHRDWSGGFDLSTVTDLATIEVVTRRSIYYIVPGGPDGELLVRGGQYLPEFIRARAIGCSMGGALLKQHAIHVGFRMEIGFDEMRLVTSPVKSVRVLAAGRD